MTNFKVLAAGALLSMAASPGFKQAAIQEPGALSFYHPNADVPNGRAPTSQTRRYHPPAVLFVPAMASAGISSRAQRCCA